MENKKVMTDDEVRTEIQRRAEAIRMSHKTAEQLKTAYERVYNIYRRQVMDGMPSIENYIAKEAYKIVLEERKNG